MTPRRIAIVAAQLRGYDRVGGAGTATTFLSLALSRMGHHIEVLYLGRAPSGMDDEWARLYARAGANVRIVPPVDTRVEPPRFGRMRTVERALRANRPDVVISHDFGAPAYSALRLRQLGLAFEDVLFVAFCHGTRLWVKEVNRNERVSPDVLAENLVERAAVELADVVVSPSAFMISWMREQGWTLPEATLVIPYLTRSAATDEQPAQVDANDGDAEVERIAFFGRLDDRKGMSPFLAGLNALSPQLLEGLELEFIGKPTKEWSPERVEGSISDHVGRALRRVSFQTDLDQHEALAALSRPGTLAVMPSLSDNSPNTVYECLERRIPFIASGIGGTGELVAPEDRSRVLFEPTAEGVTAALRRALGSRDALRPARPAFDGADSLRAWADVVAMRPRLVAQQPESPAVDAVVVHRASREALGRCLSALGEQTYRNLRVIVAATNGATPDAAVVVSVQGGSINAARAAGLKAAKAPLVVFLDEGDVPERELVESLVQAQAASGSDVVTCGLALTGGDGRSERYFSGEPGGLGMLTNDFGTVGLLRRDLLEDVTEAWPSAGDPDWPLLARLSAAGARITSIPLPLVSRASPPGTLDGEASDGLLAVEHVERGLPRELRSLARLVAGLAADAKRSSRLP